MSEKDNNKSSNTILGTFIIIVILFIGFSFFSAFGSGGKNDEFAKCLTTKGMKMYGAYWCPHCIDQKKILGKSWEHVNYIECSLPNRGGQTQACNTANIQSYPTWETSDGRRIGAVLPLEQLAEISGCSLE